MSDGGISSPVEPWELRLGERLYGSSPPAPVKKPSPACRCQHAKTMAVCHRAKGHDGAHSGVPLGWGGSERVVWLDGGDDGE